MFIAMTDSIPPSETNIIHVRINTRASFKDAAIKVFQGRTVLYYQSVSAWSFSSVIKGAKITAKALVLQQSLTILMKTEPNA